jgi:UDPglucose 6-dehydrogenase
MREAPSLAIIRGLQDAGAHVRAYDPVGMDLARTILDDVTFAEDAYDCAKGAHALVLVTEWEAFRALDLGRIRDLLATPILVDLRNVYRADEVRRKGFSYTGIGRPATADAKAGDQRLEFETGS